MPPMLQNNKFKFLLIYTAAAFSLNAVLFLIYHNPLPEWNILFKKRDGAVNGHLVKPQEVRGIYITAYTAGTKRFDELIDFIKNNDLNAAVVDIKGPTGEPAFILQHETLKKYNLKKSFYEPEQIVAKLHENNIYAIARIAVFQDPYLVEREPQFALQWKNGGAWRDYKGVRWLDPTAFGIWRYNATLAREVYERGFDEIQFDYIRFPSDGNLDAIKYARWDGKTKKEEEMEKFFTYIGGIMRREKIPASADLFGLVCCMDNYDLGIGQVLERALTYFDYISPMMYPSHYSSGFVGKKNPASFPYEVVKYSMERANEKIARLAASSTARLAKIRPWIQDFDIGDNYDTDKVMAQINASRETGAEGFLIWNARNVYTTLR